MPAITVQTMGIHYRWTLPAVLHAQLRLAHDLRETLVTLQLEHEASVKAIWSSFPAVAAAEKALAVAETEAAAAAAAVTSERVRQGTKRITGPLVERLAVIRAEVKRARRVRRDAIAEVRVEASSRMQAAADALRATQKDLYAHFCTNGDLYWATYNMVVQHHRAAIKRINQARTAGRPARLRHHHFDGTGTIAVQLQRANGQPLRTPELVADPGGKYRNVLVLPWIEPNRWKEMTRAQQRLRGRGTVRMRCGSVAGQPAWIEVPVQQHRMLDPRADIFEAQLTVSRTAGHRRARIAVAARMPDRPETSDGHTIAIHLGWRDVDAGIQIATWRSTAPLKIPTGLGSLITADPEFSTGIVIAPHRIASRVARADQLRSQRDLALESVRAKLVAWLAAQGPITHPTQTDRILDASVVARWRSPAAFAALAHAWRDAPPSGGQDIAHTLESWRRCDRARWERQEHGRGKALRHRNDIYKQVAVMFARAAGRVVVDDTSLAAIARLPSDLANDRADRIANRRTIAAPGMLRTAITAAAKREGIPVVVVAAEGLSRIHERCGYQNPSDNRYVSRLVVCDGCGATYDPDASATVLMLRRADAESLSCKSF